MKVVKSRRPREGIDGVQAAFVQAAFFVQAAVAAVQARRMLEAAPKPRKAGYELLQSDYAAKENALHYDS